MSTRDDLIEAARDHVESGALRADLALAVAYPSVSSDPVGRDALGTYLDAVLRPRLEQLGCELAYYDRWAESGNAFLIGTRIEGLELPTVLLYGHADVVEGLDEQWTEGRSPWRLQVEGDRWYGRGTADNKGQHLINLAALRLILDRRGALGFNLKVLIECGEEVGSPGLGEFATDHAELLSADVFIGSDGPRLDAETPTLFLGARGVVEFALDVDLREGSHHSGNWGGLLRNPATTLAAAIACLVDGHGRIQIPSLLPAELPASVRAALAGVVPARGLGDPIPDPDWGDRTLTAAERVYGWNTLEVLAMASGDVTTPVGAIPGTARAVLQLRFVTGTDTADLQGAVQRHLDARGFGAVRVRTIAESLASRTDPDHPWVRWASESVAETIGSPPAILPNIGGTLPNHVFESVLGLPTIWLPHSYPGCRQHAANEHMLESIAEQGIRIACGLFQDLAHSRVPQAEPPTTDRSAASASRRPHER